MKYYLPTKIILGKIDLSIKEEIDSFQPRRILLITGESIKKAGIVNMLLDHIQGYDISIFDGVESNPSPEVIKQAKKETDLIIGLGGGSVLDVAKIIATDLKKPCIAVPTTAGTGSEVTPFAALYDREKKKKLSLTVNFPEIALIDYRFTLNLPPEIVASTGMDALSQAIEAYWSIHSTPLSDVHAQKAINLVIMNLKNSWTGDAKAREAMALAALEAGRAFSQTKTTAVHSVSYPLTIHYGIPHGLACGLTLPHFLAYNFYASEEDCLDKRGINFVKERIKEIAGFFGTDNIEMAKKMILDLMESINLPTHINFNAETVIKDAFSPERVGNNPRRLTEEGLKKILEEIKL